MKRTFAAAAALIVCTAAFTGCSGKQTGSAPAVQTAAPDASPVIDFTAGYLSIDDPLSPPQYPKSYYPSSRSIVGRINCCFDVPVGFRRTFEDENSYLVQYSDPSGVNIITAESWNGYTYDEVYQELKHSLSGRYSPENMKTEENVTVGKYDYTAHCISLINDSGTMKKNMMIWIIDKPVEDDEYERDSDGSYIYETDKDTGERVKKLTSRYCFTFAVESAEENTEGMMKTALSFVTTREDMEKEGIYLG
ncbi:MAG: hypothetical protein J5501_01170 [Ruminococcus sp.]|nr:hypothetical protein [Ruminococcus sp.]